MDIGEGGTHSLYGVVDGVESVESDTNEAVDGGGAEGDVEGDPGLAERDALVPDAIVKLNDDAGRHHQGTNKDVSTGKRDNVPEIIDKR